MDVIRINERLLNPERDFIYDFLPALPFRLAVDIGAAAGVDSRRLSLAGGDDLEVVAFEPFPGNLKHFEETTRDLSNVRLVQKAISDKVGAAGFLVPSTVQGNEPDWEEFAGYSSVGYLATRFGIDALKRMIRAGLGANDGPPSRASSSRMRVKTTTIDAEFPGRTIDFMKVDTQGAEGKVLSGAKNLLKAGDISLLYVEWVGAKDVLEILFDCGYTIFDSLYVAGPRVRDPKRFEAIGFGQIKEINLSIGEIAYEMVLEDKSVSPARALRGTRRRKLGWIQTDLVAVSPKIRNAFERELSAFAQGNRPNSHNVLGNTAHLTGRTA